MVRFPANRIKTHLAGQLEERAASELVVVPAMEVHVLGPGDVFTGVHVLEHAHHLVDDLLVGQFLDAFGFVALA